ncbi:26S proteasome non-ATPase regulatory subunit 4 [Thecamonas trahens ATCC 50062]|uniref:26S proteasome non-ATPase regulatory subunit 4 n=1 Tax=Thecamonas trahens ATCC 50062 TaxID=461836 RepID=A0A0L0DK23_THETB|nr:26S proteasome non-ATPase regulatory subunit 4 [Thecamonas trahens ATCC 50062]KNC51688.1 26S proteasome non-ATPase regulatory subunit 4 [Thecamonas trahens ATCC 50062]|eukprot:XP_013755817.1 26S proteasome non-ATPase regulatory subunit 4 [Thecamonas trahens ATCC 50062]
MVRSAPGHAPCRSRRRYRHFPRDSHAHGTGSKDRMETTMVCLDNSEWMRNGDFVPTRLVAQREAAYDAGKAKLMAHPENLVGIISMAGSSARVVTNLTNDEGLLYTSLLKVTPAGTADFVAALQVAQLALKHRPNPIQRQRILLFVGSPVVAETPVLVKLAKQLKKNKVSVDVVNFGETEANVEKLEAFIAAVNSGESSNLLNVAAGETRNLRDILFSSAIMGGIGAGAVSGGMDDDVARAIALSLQEAQSSAGAATGAGDAAAAAPVAMDDDISFLTEEEQIERALAMSLADSAPPPAADEPAPMDTAPADEPAPADNNPTAVADALDDPDLLATLAGLPGLDAETLASIRGAMQDDPNDNSGNDGGDGNGGNDN